MSEEAKKTTIYDELINTFKENKYQVDVNNNIFIEKVIDDVVHQKEEVMKLILGNATLKNVFFKKIEDAFVFNPKALIEVLSAENKYLESRTTYSQSIGLTKKDDFIKTNDDVVLSFPFKDTVFVGGQDKEDEKTNENFLQEIINANEITRLFEPKVMSNIKRYSKDKVESNTTITKDDNLIIKGNNLLALHSLLDRADGEALYRGKVKLIYIDPPYNTGKDEFNYNDNFSHSTWLAFMKNRLEVAREFLSDDGVICISIDDNEQAYLKVLMDEIFGNKNFISTVINVVKPEGRRYGFIAQAHDYFLVYGKEILNTEMYEMTNSDKKLPYKDSRGNFDIVGLRNRAVKFFNSLNRPNLYYPFYVDKNNIDDNGFMPVSTEPLEGYTEVLPSIVDDLQSVWRWGKEKARVQSDEVVAKIGNDDSIRIFKKDYSQTTMPTTFWRDKELITQKGTQQIDKLFGAKVFAFPKPEKLLQRIIEISTKKNDLVMDYHLGSGTTCAVAHKMGRRYIGIEQMDYIEDIAVERMKKVIEGEQGGISKAVEWQGGGDFVYMELKELEEYKGTELEHEMQYLPIEEIEDITYGISKEEQEANFAFYGIDTKRD